MVSCAVMIRWILQRIRQHNILVVWLIIVSLVFWSSYSSYMTDPSYFYVREMLGDFEIEEISQSSTASYKQVGKCTSNVANECSLLFSRGFASVVNVSCFMVIIPMSRSFTTYIRVLGSKVSVRYVRHWIDASRTFHVICAFTLLIAGCLHSVFHLFNALFFSSNYNSFYKEINIAHFKGEDPLSAVIGTVPGVTGVLMIVILFIVSAAAMQYVREVNYDLFWFSHHLFVLFFILLLCHPISGLLKKQINISAHPPGCRMNSSVLNFSEKNILICTEVPKFVPQESLTWLWIIAGLSVYLIDFIFRLFKRRNNVEILGFQVYKCHILFMKLLKEDFVAKPGQYVFLQCPRISLLEWHPFSISECSSANSPSFTIHLRTSGDWSGSLKTLLINESSEILKTPSACEANYVDFSSTPLNQRILIDGPYSSCFEDVLKYSISICIAGGIGFTPFASILNFLRIDARSINKIKRIHLLWVCREVEIFACFAKLLSDVFRMVWNTKCPDKFELCLYLTQKQSWDTIEDTLQEFFPFFKPRLLFGRPNWNVLFERWATLYKKTDVGIFCCGPEALNCDIQKLCRKWNTHRCHFSFHHEAFS